MPKNAEAASDKRADDTAPLFEKLIDEPTLCEWLNISPAVAQRHRYQGTGPKFVTLSARRIAYRPSAVREWLASREAQKGTTLTINSALAADGVVA